MRLISTLIAALIASPALAAPFSVTDEDQNNIASICAVAARAPNVDIAVNAQVAAWCVNWQGRMKAAVAQPKPADPAPEPQK